MKRQYIAYRLNKRLKVSKIKESFFHNSPRLWLIRTNSWDQTISSSHTISLTLPRLFSSICCFTLLMFSFVETLENCPKLGIFLPISLQLLKTFYNTCSYVFSQITKPKAFRNLRNNRDDPTTVFFLTDCARFRIVGQQS